MTTSLTTYKIVEAGLRIPQLMEAAADESATDAARRLADALLEEHLEGLAEESPDKADALRFVCIRMKSSADMKRAEAKRLLASAKSDENGIERCKGLLRSLLEVRRDAGMTDSLKTQNASYWLKESVSVEIQAGYHIGLLPKGCFRLADPVANKTEIQKRLKAGETIEGCSLITKETVQWR